MGLKRKEVTPMHPNEKVVRVMFGAWSKLDAELIVSLFADDGIWHNMMVDPIQGHDALRPAVESLVSVWTLNQVEITTILIEGDSVATERIDRIDIGDESVIVSVAGFFVIESGKVKIWRDYFDLRSIEQGLNQSLL
jgi:limonene-1,2-epoxide hydrolase